MRTGGEEPRLARPSPESMAVDVFSRVKQFGFSLSVCEDSNQTMNRSWTRLMPWGQSWGVGFRGLDGRSHVHKSDEEVTVSKQIVLSAVGRDRPGVLAELSELIYRCNCKIEDSRMVLFGFLFSFMLQVSVKEDADFQRLHTQCEQLEEEKGIRVCFFTFDKETGQLGDNVQPDPDYQLRVRGKDRAGIVYRTSSLLATFGVNILSLKTQVDHSQEPSYLDMCVQVSVPRELDTEQLRNNLNLLAQELDESITLSRWRPGR